MNCKLLDIYIKACSSPIYPAIGEWLIELSNEIDLPLFRRAIEICTEKRRDLSH